MAVEQATIMVVDDEPSNLYAMRRLLEPLDLNIIEAESGEAALSAQVDRFHFEGWSCSTIHQPRRRYDLACGSNDTGN